MKTKTTKPVRVKKALVTVMHGVEGLALYVQNRRVAGPKPWGGGRVVKEWKVDVTELRAALRAGR